MNSFDYLFDAQNSDPRSRASYLPNNWESVEAAGKLQFNDGDAVIVPGISVQVTGGHTRDHQIVMIESGGKKACFLADLVPTDSHLKTPYVMGYDLYPGTTMEVKQAFLPPDSIITIWWSRVCPPVTCTEIPGTITASPSFNCNCPAASTDSQLCDK